MSDTPTPSGVADIVAFIVVTAATLIAQKWGLRPATVMAALSTPEAHDVIATRYICALGSGLSPAQAAGSVGRDLIKDADARDD
ncbi:hypothetical protein ACF09G_37440 [Streptomyces albogriseolus]|uniref:hypothetical protein n=1 Tax=Streptomyces albogriseolus TaxID=1887 RepID=UPI0019CA998B|nr:hypothetical protein [Streptomyces sp.]